MPRAPSEATQLRTTKALIKGLERELHQARQACADYRARATKAEQDVAEWKARFDQLLKVDGRPKP
jgi:phage shock protein A